MAKTETLHRGKPDARTNWQRARDDFADAKGATMVSERIVECPTCDAPMVKRVSKKEPQHVRVDLTCSADPSHSDERYGYYSNEGS